MLAPDQKTKLSILETAKVLVTSFQQHDETAFLNHLKSLFAGLAGLTVSHEIVDPAAPTTSGLPKKTVTVVGSGYVEIAGANLGTIQIVEVVGACFRVTEAIPSQPDLTDPRFVRGKPYSFGMYYSFLLADGKAIPCALGKNSSDNIVVTWAKGQGDTNYTRCRATRQFIGVDPPPPGGVAPLQPVPIVPTVPTGP